MSRRMREQFLDELSDKLGVEAPLNRMLSWDDAHELQERGIELGAHTYSHSLLANLPIDEARWEMERSRDDLRERLGIQRPPFCFPAGSVTPALIDLARKLGFRSAFQPDRHRRPNTLENADPFSLRRVGLPNGPAVELEAELDGPLNAMRRIVHSR